MSPAVDIIVLYTRGKWNIEAWETGPCSVFKSSTQAVIQLKGLGSKLGVTMRFHTLLSQIQ